MPGKKKPMPAAKGGKYVEKSKKDDKMMPPFMAKGKKKK